MDSRRRAWGTFAAALIALLMLSYASVQSSVMQPAMAASSPAGDPDQAMTGMAAAPICGAPKSAHGPAKTCAYCAAAAHPPLMGSVTPWRAPSICTFAAFRVVASHGPRGPPVLQPRARGPPANPLTL